MYNFVSNPIPSAPNKVTRAVIPVAWMTAIVLVGCVCIPSLNFLYIPCQHIETKRKVHSIPIQSHQIHEQSLHIHDISANPMKS